MLQNTFQHNESSNDEYGNEQQDDDQRMHKKGPRSSGMSGSSGSQGRTQGPDRPGMSKVMPHM